MEIVFRYSVITKEGTVFPNISESLVCDTEEQKKDARARYNELKNAGFIANLKYETSDVPTRRVVKARYTPADEEKDAKCKNNGVYTFEVDFAVNPREGLEVDDLDRHGKRVYVFAIGKDKIVPVSELGFDIKKLRKAYKGGI